MSQILDTPYHSFQLFLDSTYARKNNDTKKSDMIFYLKNPIICHPELQLLIGVNQFSFVNSMYNINEYNQNFYYELFSSPVTFFHVIPKGNYDIYQLVDYMNEHILDSFSFSYNEVSMKVVITNTQTFMLIHSVNNIFESLGFDISSSFTTTKTSNHIINLSGHQDVLNVSIDNLSLNTTDNQRENIILSTIITSSKGQYQSNNYYSSFRNVLSEYTISFFNIIIYDRQFKKVDFNNIDWCISLTFDFIRKKEIPFLQYLANNSEQFSVLDYLETKNNISKDTEKEKIK